MSDIKYIEAQEFIDRGFLQEANRLFFHPLGLALQVTPSNGEMTVWDYRDDPEGIIFGPGVLSVEKRDSVERELARHAERRHELFGDVVQSVLPPIALPEEE